MLLDYNTNEEIYEALVEVWSENIETGEVKDLDTEGDVDWEDDRFNYKFYVRNTITNVVKKFDTIWEAFDYSDHIKETFKF